MADTVWVLDRRKFLSPAEVKKLIQTAASRAEQAMQSHAKVAIRDYFITELGRSTGLRVMEIAQLTCGDLLLDDPLSSLLVQKGKGNKRRLVWFNGAFTWHCRRYLRWKQDVGEPTEEDDPLLRSSNTRGHMTTRAIEKAFKRSAGRAGLAGHYSIHCLRHTYACELYRASGYNLRLVQKQLGHSSSQITEVYADVLQPDLARAMKKLYA